MNFKQEDLMENKEEVHVYDSEADEALSLCDLPLNDRGEGDNVRRSSSDHHHHHQDFFEFFNDLNSEMNSVVVAQDIIFCGKLIPYRSPPPPPPSLTESQRNSKRNEARFIDENFPHRRSFSLSESPNSTTTKGRVMSNSNSLDYRKLQKTSSSMMTRTASSKSEKDQQQINPVRNVKPKWHLFLFGIMKTPTEMELSDIRNRQSKRIPSSLFPVLNGEQTVTVKRDGGKRSSWSVFRALGCTGANAVVTASLGCLPHV